MRLRKKQGSVQSLGAGVTPVSSNLLLEDEFVNRRVERCTMNVINKPHRWTLDYPALGTGPISAEPYFDPAVYEQEIEKIFKKSWLFAGQTQEVAEPGDFFVRELPFAKTAIIIVKGSDGVIRGFHNICTHRGNKLEWGQRGKCKGFMCKFHGWTFDTSGSLVRATDEENYFDLDKRLLGLLPVHVAVWRDFIFLNLAPQPEQSVAEYLGEWGETTGGYPWADFPCFTKYTAEVNANWKVVMDSFLETFHFGYIHKRTVASVFTTAEHPLGKMHAAQCLGMHGRLSTPGINPDFRPSPVMLAASRLIGRESSDRGERGRVALKDVAPGVNPAKVDDWVTDMNMVFPNLQIQVFANLYLIYVFWPVARDKTIFELRYCYAQPRNATEAFALEVQICDFRDIFLEDLSTNERTQEALDSGVLKQLQLHDTELIVRHWNNTLRELLGT